MKLLKRRLREVNEHPYMFIGLVLTLGLITIYCGDVVSPTPTNPVTITNTNTNTNIIAPVPSPVPSPDCTPINVTVNTENGLASITTNNPTKLSAFPSFNNSACKIQTADWFSAPSNACIFSNPTIDFSDADVTVRCTESGRVVITAIVNGKPGSSEFVVG